MPVEWNQNSTSITDLLGYINGIVIPGGDYQSWGSDVLQQYLQSVSTIINFAKDQNHAGNPYFVLGSGEGFSLALTYFSTDDGLLSSFNPSSTTINIISTTDTFRLLSSSGVQTLENTKSPFYFGITEGLSQHSFAQNNDLNSAFTPSMTITDGNGKQFIGALESKQYPFYLLQFDLAASLFQYGTQVANKDYNS